MGIEKILSNKSLNEAIFFPRVYDLCDMSHTFKIDCIDAILYCKYFEVKNSSHTVIVFYGNGECVENYLYIFPRFFNHINCNLLLVEYRGYGMSSGIPTIHSVMQDVHFIIRALSNVPFQQIILYGRSIGFFSVIEGIKKFPQIGGIILDSCNACPEEIVMKSIPFDNAEKSETMRKNISKYFDVERTLMYFKGKSLILQTRDDSIVPYTNAFILDGYLNNKSKVIIFESGGHNGIISKNAIEYFKSIKSFLGDFDNSLY